MNCCPHLPDLLAGIEGRQKGVRVHYITHDQKRQMAYRRRKVGLTTAKAEEKCNIDEGVS